MVKLLLKVLAPPPVEAADDTAKERILKSVVDRLGQRVKLSFKNYASTAKLTALPNPQPLQTERAAFDEHCQQLGAASEALLQKLCRDGPIEDEFNLIYQLYFY